MKKKLIKIFMLLVATVSIGAFVSCKDTNEDLYNELREDVGVIENGNLADRIKELEAQLATLQNCCTTGTGNLNGLAQDVATLQAILNSLTGGGAGSGSGSGSGTGGITIGGDVINIGGGSGSEQGGGTSLNDLLGPQILDLLNEQENLAYYLNLLINEVFPDGKDHTGKIASLMADTGSECLR